VGFQALLLLVPELKERLMESSEEEIRIIADLVSYVVSRIAVRLFFS
jgi:hypothetical protein